MTKTIDVSIPHQLSRDEARLRLRDGLSRFRSQFGGQVAQVEERWQDYRLNFKFVAMGQGVTGRIDVDPDAVRLSVDLPWILGVLADKLRGRVEQEGRKLLEKK